MQFVNFRRYNAVENMDALTVQTLKAELAEIERPVYDAWEEAEAVNK